jgi:integrase
MGRRTQDAAIGSPAARAKLPVQVKPHYRAVQPGLHLGYAKRARGKPGTWCARHYCGGQRYEVEALMHHVAHGKAPCVADDQQPADGNAVLSYAQALDRARQRYAERANEAAGIAKPATVATALDAYLRELEAHRKNIPDARDRARVHIYPTLGDIELAALTTDQLNAWLFNLADAPARKRNGVKEHDASDDEAVRRRRASANRTLTTLKAALNHAFRADKVASDKAWRKLKPFDGVEKARQRWLTLDEAQRLIAACDDEFRPLVQAALQTGARYGALRQMRVEDFEAAAGTVLVRENNKGKKNRPYKVPLSDEGAAFFAALCAGRPGHELMLLRSDGQPWRRNNQQRLMALACLRAGIKPPAPFHTLRHTRASLATMNGTPLPVVAKSLGHSDTAMVEKHYGHLAPDYISNAIRKGAPRFGAA